MGALGDDEKDLEQLIGLMKHYANEEKIDLLAYPGGTVSEFLNVAEVLLDKPFAEISPVKPKSVELARCPEHVKM